MSKITSPRASEASHAWTDWYIGATMNAHRVRTPAQLKQDVVTNRTGLQRLQDSSLAWRLRGGGEPEMLVLPRESAAQLFARVMHEETAARSCPDLTIQTIDVDASAVETALRALRPRPDESVVASWNETDAVVMAWVIFCSHWSQLCYPSSDELTVVSREREWLLYWDLSCVFRWKHFGSPTAPR